MLEFRAGRMSLEGKRVVPDTRKGLIRIVRVGPNLGMEFHGSGNSEIFMSCLHITFSFELKLTSSASVLLG